MKAWRHLIEVDVGLDFGSGGVRKAGTIATTGEQVFFAYDETFLDEGVNPAPFCLPFDSAPYPLPIRNGAPGTMFADAVPDGWARHLLDARLIEAGYDPLTLNPVDRLALVGGNGLGALSFAPAADVDVGVQALSLEDLAATILGTKGRGDAGLETARRYAGSLGGARPKANVWLHADGSVSSAPKADTVPWIVKFPKPGVDPEDAGPIEYAYSLMARAAGISMTATRLLEVPGGPGYFATARFDRYGDRRFHYQSLSGLLDHEPLQASSYGDLLGVGTMLTGDDGPDEQLIRRMVFNVVAGNRDDHSRNHGFLMDADGLWVPSPAFDVTFEPLTRHVLVVGSNAASPGEADLAHVVEEAGGDGALAKDLYRVIRDVVAEWPSFARSAGVSANTTERIGTAIRSLGAGDPGPAIAGAMAAARAWGR